MDYAALEFKSQIFNLSEQGEKEGGRDEDKRGGRERGKEGRRKEGREEEKEGGKENYLAEAF